MKVAILAGGLGTRIGEETVNKPKPMITIGGKPILWHILKYYSSFGFNEFLICAGYRQEVIKEYFNNYALYNSDVTFDFKKHGEMTVHSDVSEDWRVTVVDTGLNTMTGGRIKRLKDYIGNEPFMMTYGDGVSNVDLNKLLEQHNKNKTIVTMTAIQPEGRFGIIDFGPGGAVRAFREKNKDDSGWINGGFMVVEPEIFDLIEGDATVFEREPLEGCVKLGRIDAYKHRGFWQCMDTLRDREKLESLWNSDKAPWKIW